MNSLTINTFKLMYHTPTGDQKGLWQEAHSGDGGHIGFCPGTRILCNSTRERMRMHS